MSWFDFFSKKNKVPKYSFDIIGEWTDNDHSGLFYMVCGTRVIFNADGTGTIHFWTNEDTDGIYTGKKWYESTTPFYWKNYSPYKIGIKYDKEDDYTDIEFKTKFAVSYSTHYIEMYDFTYSKEGYYLSTFLRKKLDI